MFLTWRNKLKSSEVNGKIYTERRKVWDWLSKISLAEELRMFPGEDLLSAWDSE